MHQHLDIHEKCIKVVNSIKKRYKFFLESFVVFARSEIEIGESRSQSSLTCRKMRIEMQLRKKRLPNKLWQRKHCKNIC